MNGLIGKCIEEYLRILKSRKYSGQSVKAWRDRLGKWRRFMDGNGIAQVQDVTREHLEKYRLFLAESGMATTSVYIYFQYVQRFFKHLEEDQQIFSDPASGLLLPKFNRKLQPVPTERDMKRLLAQPDVSTPTGVRDRTLIETAYSTGLRLEELSRLNVFDPDMKEGTVRVMGKGSKERVAPLGRQALFWLARYTGETRKKLLRGNPDEHALWLGRNGGRLHPVIIQQNIREYGRQAKLSVRITPHSLRRACATHMLRGGAHPVQVQFLLGHASLKALSQYLKVTVEDVRKMHRKSKPGR